MTTIPLIVLQRSAMSKIFYVFESLRENPPVKLVLKPGESVPPIVMRDYLKRDSVAHSKIMLIVNYLSALLLEGRNNKISIYNNFQNKQEEIDKFALENADLLERLKNVRDKVCSHLDPDWIDYARNISFEEMQICIDFLNKIIGWDSANPLGENNEI